MENKNVGLSAISLFSGVGGLDLAAKSEGIKTVCYVEWDRYAQGVLMSRIRDGRLDDAPIWTDVTTFDAKAWRGKVDIVFGGFPCQPHSAAGQRGGAEDKRNLWPDTMRILRESGAWGFVGENVTGIITNGFAAQVMADLEREDFCGTLFSNTACSSGAPHMRGRVFFVSHSNRIRRSIMDEGEEGRCSDEHTQGDGVEWVKCPSDLLLDVGHALSNPSSGVRRVDDGLWPGVDRLRCCGNGVVPSEAAPAFGKLKAIARNLASK